MSKATRKHITPRVLVTALGVVVALALMAAGVWLPGAAQAQQGPDNPFAPPAPTGVTATEASGPQVNVSWTAGSGGLAITGYEVERKVGSGSFAGVDPAHPGTTTSYIDTNVESGMTYTYRVRANSGSNSNSDWVESNSVTVTAPVTSVDTPMGVSVGHGGGAGQVVVEWTMSADVDSYEVTYRVPGGTIMTDSTDAMSPHTITGLMAQTAYEVCVIAVVDGDKSAPACDSVTTSRYLLTFDLRQFGSPNRMTDKQKIVIMETPGATVTLRATVWVPDPIASSDETDTVAVRFMSDPADVTVTTANLLAVSENSIDDGELTIRPRDGDKRSFQISFDCVQDPTVLTVSIYDDDVQRVERGTITINCGERDPEAGPGRTDESDAFTVVSYGDWEYDDVTDGFILDVSNGNPHLVNAHPHSEMGLLRRDEPVMHELYTLGVSDKEMLKNLDNGSPRRAKEDPDNLLTRQEKNAYVEEGQRTVEVLTGQPNVQLTVTSMKSGPVYIRFLDSDMQPFGTDVDEESMWRGADVVGLDSQGRLELNNQEMELSKALALAYDQYNIVTPGAIPGQRADNSYLSGKDGTYNQGAFRFMNPCPSVGHHFYVEVYEPTGKYLRTTEKIDCVRSPKPGPAGLVFEIDSQKPGEGVLRFEPARNAVSHTVLLIDASNRKIVQEVEDAVSPVMFNEEDNVKLNNGWTYHIVVIAAGVNDQYTADAVLSYGVSWLDEADVPLSTDPSGDPTRMHPLCQVDDADITALLAVCDMVTAPSGLMPSDVTATTDPGTLLVQVDWTPGAGAVGHLVMLFTDDWQGAPMVEGMPTGNSHTFTVDAGSYIAVVVAYDADVDIQLAISGVTSVGPS